jgi:four helix bundle protein
MNYLTNQPVKKPQILKEKTLQFAVRIVKLYQHLRKEKLEFVMSTQILKSGTNPGAMVREALNAESGADFIHKLGVAQKEIGETQYWLELLSLTQFITEQEFESMYADAESLMKMTRSAILTKKKNMLAKISVLAIGLTCTFLLLT